MRSEKAAWARQCAPVEAKKARHERAVRRAERDSFITVVAR
jgi:hypothetical protein